MSAAHVEELPEKPLPPAITQHDATECLRRLACEKLASGKAAVEAGYCTEVHPDILRDVAILDALHLIMLALLPEWEAHRKMIRQKRYAARDGR